jgi:hypothetical protein
MNDKSPLQEGTERTALIFSGKWPVLQEEWDKLKWFGYGALGATALIIIFNLSYFRR